MKPSRCVIPATIISLSRRLNRDEGVGIHDHLFEEKIWSEMIADYILSAKGFLWIPTPSSLSKQSLKEMIVAGMTHLGDFNSELFLAKSNFSLKLYKNQLSRVKKKISPCITLTPLHLYQAEEGLEEMVVVRDDAPKERHHRKLYSAIFFQNKFLKPESY